MSNVLRRTHPLRALPVSVLAAGLLLAVQAHAQPADQASAGHTATDRKKATELGEVRVVAQRADRVSNGATNLDLDIKDTPQSISVVDSEQMRDFGANDVNDALRLTTGINVEQWETDRSNYTARGFDIENTQIDGVGMPNGWGIVTGALDAYGYDKIEVIRGANGLLTGVGNASGTINYVRKRPTNEAQGEAGISYGSWGSTREQFDYSTPFNDSRTWAGRIVAAHEDDGSYLRGLDNKRDYLYGVVDGQVGENGTLTLGYSYQKARTNGNMWGALTYNLVDGSQIGWNRSASAGQDWTYWNTQNNNAFVEYTYALSDDWQVKATYNYQRFEEDDLLLDAYTTTGLDPRTHEGLVGWAYRGNDTTTEHMGNVSINGHFDWLGHDQEVMLGASSAYSNYPQYNYPIDSSQAAFGPLPGFPYAGDAIPKPTWGDRTLSDTLSQHLKRVFGATHLTLTDKLKAVLGFNYAAFRRNDTSSGAQSQTKLSPYGGLTYDFSDNVLGYVSYSDIFQPQDYYDIHHVYLKPTKGVNYEAGVKADWFGKRLLTTLAVFDAKQKNLGTYAGMDLDTFQYYYVGEDVESKGWEFEATGKLNDYVSLVLGYTHLTLDGDKTLLTTVDGRINPWIPRNTANFLLSARVPGHEALSFGVGGNWRDRTANVDSYTGYAVRQSAYAVYNAFAAWEVVRNLTLRANINNIGDKKYIGSLYSIGYYGAPRNYMVSLNWKF
jgi:outer membrane receptor for ferric coprogen and ferric-rhodotorulic acid